MVDLNPARGMPLQLQRYWLAGKGALKIRWNVPGDFMRCVHQLEKYFPTDPKGLCNILHTKATGGPPGHGLLEPKKLHHSIDTEASLTAAAALLATQPKLGDELWAGPLAPIGRPTGEPATMRQFDPGALMHRTLPLPVQHRRVNGPGHAGGVVVGRVLGITNGPDENGDEYCWGWGDWLDPNVVPEVTEAKYLVDKGVAGPSVDPGGPVAAVLNPETGVSHMRTYTIGGVTLVAIPAFSSMRWQMAGYPPDDADMKGDYAAMMNMPPMPTVPSNYSVEEDCGCAEPTFAVNPPGWRGLSLAARDSPFDNDMAIQRIAAWAGIGTPTPDISKMKRAFMWKDDKLPDTDPTAYRLPVGDIINGKLTLMYHAIYAAAALLNGAHGGLPSVDVNEKNQLRNEISSIYQEMAQEYGDSSIKAPWDQPNATGGGQFAMADNPQKPYGNVAYADPGYQQDKKKRYPIDTADHVRAAWAYINKSKNAGMYQPDQLKKIKDAIMAAAKKMGVDIAADTDGDMSLLEPPGWWFDDPVLPQKTAFTVDANGRVYGHLAAWNECHRDVTNRECVLAPHSKLGYRPFHLGQVRTAEGNTIQVGKVVQDTRHADIHLGYMSAAIHYDNTGDEIAIVRAGEDEYGIWVAGAVVPDASPKAIAKLRRSPLSGDWRRVENNLELTAALAVNVPAFPVYSMEGDGDRFALTAAGQVFPEYDDEEPEYDFSGRSADEVYTALVEMATQQQGEEDDEQEQRAQWLRDLQDDEEIYTQRIRSKRLETLRAAMATAPTTPTGGPLPAPDGAGPNTTAPTPSANAPAPAAPAPQAPGNPTDSGAPVGADENTDMLQRQMNASFSVVQLPDGSTPPSSAPGTTAPQPAAVATKATAAPAPAVPAPVPTQ